ncbi:MAG TPA: hypothetical protein VJU61_04485 [Polyangiaceae bacterium]|nr:hypothetical protein [Polyangiaceae bacterium]
MTPRLACRSVAAAGLFTLLTATTAFAEDNIVVTSTPPAEQGILPNPTLLRSGLFTLGAAYVPALVVAITSDRSSDNHLYAPIIGPWMDLGAREDCGGDCSDKETVNRVLLVTDGVFQGLGALQIVGSLFFPEQRVMTVHGSDGAPVLALSVMPARFGRGANGVQAVGEF